MTVRTHLSLSAGWVLRVSANCPPWVGPRRREPVGRTAHPVKGEAAERARQREAAEAEVQEAVVAREGLEATGAGPQSR